MTYRYTAEGVMTCLPFPNVALVIATHTRPHMPYCTTGWTAIPGPFFPAVDVVFPKHLPFLRYLYYVGVTVALFYRHRYDGLFWLANTPRTITACHTAMPTVRPLCVPLTELKGRNLLPCNTAVQPSITFVQPENWRRRNIIATFGGVDGWTGWYRLIAVLV